jgi:hypothetical protein
LTPRIRDRAILGVVAIGVACYFLWLARTANGRFDWKHDSNGFYNLLARGFLGGHLYTPIQPSAKLLAMPNPWDPSLDDSVRWQDMALYNGHYYLYFGAAPAVVLFAPWRALTGHDLPENFGICVLSFAGFLFSCGTLLRMLELAEARPGPVVLAFLFAGLGVCQSVPFLLSRSAMYEIAIAGGYCFVSGGLYFLARRRWAVSGVMFGLAVASRPHLVLVGGIALAALLWRPERRRGALRFAAGLATIGLAIGAYNFERFGNPLEFGFRYQLAGPGQNRIELAPRNVVPGTYFMLLSKPELSRVFPWMRMVFRFPFDSAEKHPLPALYFVEPSVGALWLAPFLPLALLAFRRRALKQADEVRLIGGIAAAGGLAALAFLVSTHLSTHRYEVDFAGLLVFAAIASLALTRGRVVRVLACVLIAYSAVANFALAVQGPYDDFLRTNPRGYVRLARRFSPAAEFRAALDPAVAVRFRAQFAPEPAGMREPLVTLGHAQHCYFLFVVRGGATMKLISKGSESEMAYDMPDPGRGSAEFDLAYAPETGEMTVKVNGQEALRHHVGPLVAAPAELVLGANFADMGLTARRFGGQISVAERTVEERR